MSAYPEPDGIDLPPIKAGAILGAFAFLLGYATTAVVVALGEAEHLADDMFESAGWIYYNAQFADLDLRLLGDTGFDGGSVNYLTDNVFVGEAVTTVDVPALVYHLVPIVVLVGAGFALGRYVDAQDVEEGAVAGVTLVSGVIGFALVGTFLFTHEGSFLGLTVEMSPALAEGVLFVGVIYPAIFGAIGGMLSSQV